MKKSLAIILCLSVAPSALFAGKALDDLKLLTDRLQQALVLDNQNPDQKKNLATLSDAIVDLITKGTTIEALKTGLAYEKTPLGLTGQKYGFSDQVANENQAKQMFAALDLAAFAAKPLSKGLAPLKAPVGSKTGEDIHKSIAIKYYNTYDQHPMTDLTAVLGISQGRGPGGTLVPFEMTPYGGSIYVVDEKNFIKSLSQFPWIKTVYKPNSIRDQLVKDIFGAGIKINQVEVEKNKPIVLDSPSPQPPKIQPADASKKEEEDKLFETKYKEVHDYLSGTRDQNYLYLNSSKEGTAKTLKALNDKIKELKLPLAEQNNCKKLIKLINEGNLIPQHDAEMSIALTGTQQQQKNSGNPHQGGPVTSILVSLFKTYSEQQSEYNRCVQGIKTFLDKKGQIGPRFKKIYERIFQEMTKPYIVMPEITKEITKTFIEPIKTIALNALREKGPMEKKYQNIYVEILKKSPNLADITTNIDSLFKDSSDDFQVGEVAARKILKIFAKEAEKLESDDNKIFMNNAILHLLNDLKGAADSSDETIKQTINTEFDGSLENYITNYKETHELS